MSKKSHRLKIEFSYFREPFDLSSRVTGAIWEVFRGKYFSFKIPTHLGPKTATFRSKMVIFDPWYLKYLRYQGSKITIFDLKVAVFGPKWVGILKEKYFPLNTSQMAPVTRLDRSKGSRKYENSIFSLCDFLLIFVQFCFKIVQKVRNIGIRNNVRGSKITGNRGKSKKSPRIAQNKPQESYTRLGSRSGSIAVG